ncbi:nuclease [Xaviernesmea oryzae]|uniref:Nuclease n=2 Tax=Xaviernesmea oryzae TaxID=464029 RepID=A0A1Q9AU61_9HYPH|nr:nuclease [Xaviernesmea oryzae]
MLRHPTFWVAVFSVCAVLPSNASAERGRIVWVIDGDTFRMADGERIRIAGIDAAETDPAHAKCAAEIVIGKKATAEAISLLKGRTVDFERVGRSYRRTVARVRLEGRDLSGDLVAKGIARPWAKGRPKPDWCG